LDTNNPALPDLMTVIEIVRPGGPEVLVASRRSVPRPGAGEVLIRHHAAGINGPDVLQRKGLYAPPAGASDLPGLEVAGEVAALGEGVTRLRLGDRVAALVPGGGYAEYSVATESNVMLLPAGLSMAEAAAVPESFLTVWLNLFQRGQFKHGETVLIHGGASGIGTTATMLSKAFGAATIITTVGSEAHRQASLQLGADIAVNYREEDFVEVVQRATEGRGVDVIVDIVAGDYVARNYQAAAMNARIVQIGVIGGIAKELDLSLMLIKRLTHTGSTLRSRTPAEKAQLIRSLEEQVWPLLAAGTVKPLIYQTFPLAQARQAHELMDSGKHSGKIVLTMDAA